MDTEHLPNDKYVARMPSPPRIQLLQSYSNTCPPIDTCPDFTRPNFLKDLDLTSCLVPPQRPAVSWLYEYRHVAQQVLPFILLGPRAAARDAKFLIDAGVTMILTVRHGHPSNAKPLPGILSDASKLGIETPIVDVYSNQSLISILPTAVRDINNHMDKLNAARRPADISEIAGSVFVCCDSGNERSAAIVVAYIMETFGVDLLGAHRVVQDHRFCISVNDSMKQTLRSYEDILNARRDVEHMSGAHEFALNQLQPEDAATPSVRASKRLLEADSDDDMQDADDVARFRGRGFTPFQD